MNNKSDHHLTNDVIAAALEVHRDLGPGLPERAYETALSLELHARGMSHRCQVSLPVSYRGFQLECSHRMDCVVEDSLLLELKAVRAIEPVHLAQTLTYLQISGLSVGLLLNFDVLLLRDGIRRVVLSPPRWVPKCEGWINPGNCTYGMSVAESALRVWRELGPGLLKLSYETCLCFELSQQRVPFERYRQFPVHHRGQELGSTIEVPLLVAGTIPVFCRSDRFPVAVIEARVRSVLVQTRFCSAYLINFGAHESGALVRRVES